MATDATLGTVIRERRLALGLTQEQLAERIGGGVRQAEVSRLEADRIGLPRRERLTRIAGALELPVSDLLKHSGWNLQRASAPGPSATNTPPGAESAAVDDLAARLTRIQARVRRVQAHVLALQQDCEDLTVQCTALQAELAEASPP